MGGGGSQKLLLPNNPLNLEMRVERIWSDRSVSNPGMLRDLISSWK